MCESINTINPILMSIRLSAMGFVPMNSPNTKLIQYLYSLSMVCFAETIFELKVRFRCSAVSGRARVAANALRTEDRHRYHCHTSRVISIQWFVHCLQFKKIKVTKLLSHANVKPINSFTLGLNSRLKSYNI